MTDRSSGVAAPISAPPMSAPVTTGTLLAGRYALVEALGAGGMGSVWRAHDRELDEHIALKLLHDDLLRDADALARFKREAKIARRISHPNVARVFDLGEDGGRRYLTMELVDGRPLTDLIEREAPLSATRVVDFALQTCAGLAAAHAAGIVHRDLKPDNLLLTATGRLVITDFGIAHARGAVRLTATHATLGTPAYMAPEQVESRPDIDARADLYALGAVMFEMLTGTPPWEGDSVYLVAAARVLEQPPDPRSRGRVADELAEIVLRCLAREPRDRFDDAPSLAAALRRTPAASAGPLSIHASSAPEDRDSGMPPVVAVALRGEGELMHGACYVLEQTMFAARAVWLEPLATSGAIEDLLIAARDAGAQALLVLSARAGASSACPSIELRSVDSGELLLASTEAQPLPHFFACAAAVAEAIAGAFATTPRAVLPAGPVSGLEVERFLRATSLAMRWRTNADGDRALALLDASLRSTPDDPWVNAVAAGVLLRRFLTGAGEAEDLEQARLMAELSLRAAPELVAARATLAEVLLELGRAEAAAREIGALMREQPHLAEPHLVAGRAWLVVGDARRALVELERASELGAADRARLDLAYARELCGSGDGLALLGAAPEGERDSWRYWLARVRIAAWRGPAAGVRAEVAALGARPIAHRDEVLAFAGCMAGSVALQDARRYWSALAEGARSARRRRAALRACEAELLAARGARDLALSLLSLSGLGSDASDMLPLAWLEHCPLLASLRAHPAYRTLRERLLSARKDLRASLTDPLPPT